MHGDIVPTHWQTILEEIRKESGLSKAQLGRRINMSQRTVADYENKKMPRHLSIYKVETILNALGYEMDFFLKPGGQRVLKQKKKQALNESHSSV